ncbi:UbiA family prenyltransferase [Streptomyces solisilvae]|uniref:UbiA family prenyltransferase n=1 Tax=Streptomyces malaysiensis TaxID=92644 RepID=UPI0036A76164
MELLLVTTVPTMVLAHRGLPNLPLMAATLIGGAASSGSASAFNMYLDRDMDARMRRTATFSMPLSRTTPRRLAAHSAVRRSGPHSRSPIMRPPQLVTELT